MTLRLVALLGGAVAVCLSVAGCAKNNSSSPTAPTSTTTTTTAVSAPPPAGVSAGVWQVAFLPTDNAMHRAVAPIHVVLPSDATAETKDLFASVAAQIGSVLQGNNTIDTTNTTTGVVYTVKITPGLVCGGVSGASGCTTVVTAGTGEVISGTMEFVSAAAMLDRNLVQHELYRTLGMTRNSPSPGVMAQQPAASPTAEEIAMFLGRYKYPNGAVYAAQ